MVHLVIHLQETINVIVKAYDFSLDLEMLHNFCVVPVRVIRLMSRLSFHYWAKRGKNPHS